MRAPADSKWKVKQNGLGSHLFHFSLVRHSKGTSSALRAAVYDLGMNKVRKEDGAENADEEQAPPAPFAVSKPGPVFIARSWEALAGVVGPSLATHYRVRAQHAPEHRFSFNGDFFELFDQENGTKPATQPPTGTGTWRCEFYKLTGPAGKPGHPVKVPIRPSQSGEELEVIVTFESTATALLPPSISAQPAQRTNTETPLERPRAEALTHAGLTQVLGTVLSALDNNYKQQERREAAIDRHMERLEQSLERAERQLAKQRKKLRKSKESQSGIVESIGRAIENNPEVLQVVTQNVFGFLATLTTNRKTSSAENEEDETA